MANRRISSSDLILYTVKLTQVQKKFLDSLEKGKASAFIRKLIDDAMDNHQADIAKLDEEIRGLELHLSIAKAQREEYDKETNRQQNLNEIREQLLEQQTQIFIKTLERNGGNFKEIRQAIKNIEPGLKSKLNGDAGAGNIVEELEKRVIKVSKTRGVKLYGA